MSDDRDILIRRQELQWQMHLDLYQHNDKISVTVGTEVLKTAVLVNAGAAVALLAFTAQLWDRGPAANDTARQILLGAKPFFVGSIAAGIAFMLAYVYSYLLTWRRYRAWGNFGEPDAAKHKSERPLFIWALFVAVFVVLVVILSFGAFAFGVWREMGLMLSH